MENHLITPPLHAWAKASASRIGKRVPQLRQRRPRKMVVVHLDGVPRTVLDEAVALGDDAVLLPDGPQRRLQPRLGVLGLAGLDPVLPGGAALRHPPPEPPGLQLVRPRARPLGADERPRRRAHDGAAARREGRPEPVRRRRHLVPLALPRAGLEPALHVGALGPQGRRALAGDERAARALGAGAAEPAPLLLAGDARDRPRGARRVPLVAAGARLPPREGVLPQPLLPHHPRLGARPLARAHRHGPRGAGDLPGVRQLRRGRPPPGAVLRRGEARALPGRPGDLRAVHDGEDARGALRPLLRHRPRPRRQRPVRAARRKAAPELPDGRARRCRSRTTSPARCSTAATRCRCRARSRRTSRW